MIVLYFFVFDSLYIIRKPVSLYNQGFVWFIWLVWGWEWVIQFTFLFIEDECVYGGGMELFFIGLDFEGVGV